MQIRYSHPKTQKLVKFKMLRIILVVMVAFAATTTVSGKSLAEAMQEREKEPLQSSLVGVFRDDEHSS